MTQQAARSYPGSRAPRFNQHDEPLVVLEQQQAKNGSGSFKDYVLWGIIGTAAAGTLIYFGYKIITTQISNHANKGSLDSNDPAYFAKQFKIGFDNNNAWGTDTDTVRQTMVAIPSKDVFKKVATSYHKQYQSNLYKDLEKNLKSTEFQEMQAIYKIKPEKAGKNAQTIYDPYAWAERIHDAVNYETFGWLWGTDEEAIKQVFREITDQKAWDDTQAAYEAKYTLDIKQDIDDDLDPSDFDFRAELKKKNITA